jgi:type I restriction enzyme S subunit
MELKAGYKQTEVGIIPEDWEVKRVGTICDFIVPGRNKPKVFNGGICWVTTPDLQGKFAVYDSNLKITKEIAKSVGSKIVPKNSVIMTCVGDLGIVAIAGVEMVINQQLHAFLPNDNIDFIYLYFALSNKKKYMEEIATKTAVPYMNKTNCNSIPIPIPPTKAEQAAIATALSDVDALISELNSEIAKKRLIKQGAMQELLSGKKRLAGFSGDWEVKKLGDITEIDSDNLSSSTSPEYIFNYISLEDVDFGRLKNTTELQFKNSPSRARRKIKKGDVLVSTVRPNLKSHLIIKDEVNDWICSTGFSVIRCNHVNPYYIFNHFFSSIVNNQIETIITGSNYPAINSTDIKNLLIPLPPTKKEQTAIAQILSDMDSDIQTLETERNKTLAIKQGMMQNLLTGKIRLI